MAGIPSSAATVPTASTKKMRVRSKSTSAVDDMKDEPMEESKPKFQGFKRPMNNGINGIRKEENLFVKGAKDKLADRKSRSGRRGLPKKGGAGGKGTWGVIGEVINEEDMKVKDHHDPNYESEEDENEPFRLKECKPELTEIEFTQHVEPIVQEYYEHGDTYDVALSLDELNILTHKYKVVVMSIRVAMEKKATQREMASILVSDLYGVKLITLHDVTKGFHQLLEDLEDMMLDTPEAPEILGKFIARAIADDCLPPVFVNNSEDTPTDSPQRVALHKADVLIRKKHGMVRLDSVWGVVGGRRPVKHLIKKMVLLLKEYISSEDVEEACHCVQELEVPHFHHELVYELIVMTLEDGRDRILTLMKNLLKTFSATNIVTPDQIKNGFERVFSSMPEVWLDIPNAHIVLEKFTHNCARDAIVPISYTLKVPSKGRKRFVSEGDGGLVKA